MFKWQEDNDLLTEIVKSENKLVFEKTIPQQFLINKSDIGTLVIQNPENDEIVLSSYNGLANSIVEVNKYFIRTHPIYSTRYFKYREFMDEINKIKPLLYNDYLLPLQKDIENQCNDIFYRLLQTNKSKYIIDTKYKNPEMQYITHIEDYEKYCGRVPKYYTNDEALFKSHWDSDGRVVYGILPNSGTIYFDNNKYTCEWVFNKIEEDRIGVKIKTNIAIVIDKTNNIERVLR